MSSKKQNRQQIVLITGATAGIGRHAALHLARRGFHVFATGRRADALEALAQEAGGLPLEALELDVTDGDSIDAARREIDLRTGGYGVDVLVNNAGYGQVGPVEEITDDQLRRQYETNVFGLLAVTRAFLPAMRRRGSGRIINVSSIGGRATFPFMGVYNSTKYALESLSDALRNELHPFGIKVVLIEPGVIRTSFADTAMGTLDLEGATGSPYAPLAAEADKLRQSMDDIAVGPECISRAIERAITRRRPAARYMAPFRTKLALVLLQVLPTPAGDWILRRQTGIRRELLAPRGDQLEPGAA